MFNNKKDVLLESVKKVIQESERHRKLEAELNEAYGIVSRAALPNEYVAEYDAILAEAKQTGSLPRNPREKSLAALANPKHKDVLKGRGVIEQTSEEKKMNESLEAIQEEIRNTLWEKLDYVYENYGEEAAMEMYASLTEEEQAILSEEVISVKSGAPRGSDMTMGLGAHPVALQAARAREASIAPRTPVTRDEFSRSHAPQPGRIAFARRAAAEKLFDKIKGQRSSGEGEDGSAQDTGTRNAPAPAATPSAPVPDAKIYTPFRPTQNLPGAFGEPPTNPQPATSPAPPTSGQQPAATAPKPTQQRPTIQKPESDNYSGPFAGQPEWARKAFMPSTGG